MLLNSSWIKVAGNMHVEEEFLWAQVITLLELVGSRPLDRGRAGNAARFLDQPKSQHVLGRQRSVDVFRQDVRGVVSPKDLQKSEVLVFQSVLHPQICSRKVPDLA